MKFILSIFLCLIMSFQAFAQLQSPSEFLGYKLGEHWTPHYKVMQYVQHVADESGMVTAQHYGTTYEGRELMYAVVTSQENHASLNEIRLNNLRMTGLEDGELTEQQKAVVWLSYNVHGNETSSSEAAMLTLYTLITEKQAWLEETVVILDPMINPDGRDRYVNWYKTMVGSQPNVKPESREHNEPWPGGRPNHYYFDLNRDWAWQTQVESRQRVQEYLKWMPHVHVDFHEQFYNSPYYFAPAAKPFHKAITDWQRELQTMIGKNHADYFDAEGWLYFTKESFDLFYPSYGDTWPTFNGSVGMTYEQAGHGRAGLGIITDEGDTLTLHDRLTHHTVTGLSTVEVAANNREQMVTKFAEYFENTRENGSGSYTSYVVSRNSNPDKVAMLMRYLIDQKIRVQEASQRVNTNGFDYSEGREGRVTINEGDFVITTKQPQGNLVRVLFEPNPELEDSLTYDLTAWEMHYAYGVKGFAVKQDIPVRGVGLVTDTDMPASIEKPYAYLLRWGSLEDLKFLAYLLKNEVNVRYNQDPFSLNGEQFDRGTLIITRRSNEKLGDDFDEIVKDAASLFNRQLYPSVTGFVETGKDFGSGTITFVDAPQVALVSGEGTSSQAVGQIWHFFDQVIGYPVSLINKDDLGETVLSDYDVLFITSGGMNSQLGMITDWVKAGGTLIALEGANRFLAGKDGFLLKARERETDDADPNERLVSYDDARRSFASSINAGSVYELTMDVSHPLAFGYTDTYYSLKLGSTAYEYLDGGWNVGIAKSGQPRSGFVGSDAREQLEASLSFGVQDMGRGKIVYMIDNPLFRAFWHNGKLLVGNAVFLLD